MRTAKGILLVSVVLALAGCSSPSAPSPSAMSRIQEQTERSAEVDRLAWPDDAAPTGFAEYPEGAIFQAGVGANQADIAWICAWSREWLATRDVDTYAAAKAIGQLEQIESLPLWANLDRRGQDALIDAVSQARSGDAAALISQRQALACS
jgi:hypothetical protein